MTPLSSQRISFQTIRGLVQQWPKVRDAFSQKGYVVLSPPDSHAETALRVSRLFGHIQGHKRAPLDGVVEIRSRSLGENAKQIVSDLAFFAHTDGAYLQGLASTNGRICQVSPPKMVALQCVYPAKKGGVSFLVDGQKILNDLAKTNPGMIKELMESPITICRNRHLVNDAAVVRRLATGIYAFRFSYDQDLYASKQTNKILSIFNQKYVQCKNYITYLSLKEKEILVFDNHRHLHGRTEIEGERFFRRIWIQDEALSMPVETPKGLPYFGSIEKNPSPFENFEPYLRVKLPFRSPKVATIPTGIYLE